MALSSVPEAFSRSTSEEPEYVTTDTLSEAVSVFANFLKDVMARSILFSVDIDPEVSIRKT